MSQTNAITTLYQLQKKYDCNVSSYYESVTRSMLFTATLLSCSPRFGVSLQVPELDIIDRADRTDTSIEKDICQYFDMEFSKFLGVKPGIIEEPVEKDAVISINDWKQTHERSTL